MRRQSLTEMLSHRNGVPTIIPRLRTHAATLILKPMVLLTSGLLLASGTLLLLVPTLSPHSWAIALALVPLAIYGILLSRPSSSPDAGELDHATGPARILPAAHLSSLLAHRATQFPRFAVIVIRLDWVSTPYAPHSVSPDILLDKTLTTLASMLRAQDRLLPIDSQTIVLISDHLPSPTHAGRLAQRIHAILSQPMLMHAEERWIVPTLGVALYPDDTDHPQDLVTLATTASARTPADGNTLHMHASQTEHEPAVRPTTLLIRTTLHHALDRDQLVLHYQPRIHLATGRITGMEALIRWQHPEHGAISPQDFIPLAEETGLIIPIGEWALRTAMTQTKAWQEHGVTDLRVSVNLSSRQFRQPGLARMIETLLQHAGLAPQALELELTESILVQDVKKARDIFHTLRAMGIAITMDDFGTGYSSFEYLMQFEVNALKIDHKFIHNLTVTPRTAAIASALLMLGRNLALKIVAEGVERYDQVQFLREHHCDEVQGYLFSPALPATEFGELIKKEEAWRAQQQLRQRTRDDALRSQKNETTSTHPWPVRHPGSPGTDTIAVQP